METMTKEEIARRVQWWIDGGKLMSVRQTGKVYAEIDRGIAKGDYHLTKIRSVVATDALVADAFNALCDERRVMTFHDVRLNHPQYKTLYAVNKAALTGVFLKFFGFRNVPLYIK